jgi:hypothetical protein
MLERNRGEPAVGAVSPAGVVEVHDPGRDPDPGLGPSSEVLPVHELDLERGVERLGGGVVQTICNG